MFRIVKPKTNQRLDLAPGAWLIYREATAIENEAGAAASREFFRALREGRASLEAYDLEETIGSIDDGGLTAGLSHLISLTEIAVLCVSEWHGIGDAEGAPLSLNRANLCAMLRDPGMHALMRDKLLARLFAIDEEGNASALSPNGALAGASNIASGAARAEAPAPTESPA